MSGVSWQSGGVKLNIPFSRAGVSTVMLLECAGRMNFVECGDGASSYLYSLLGRSGAYEKLDSVIVTHEHMDHSGGLNALLWLLEVAGRKGGIDILTPGGGEGGLMRSAEPLISTLSYEVRFVDSSAGSTHRIGGITVSGFQTMHRSSFPSNRCGDPVRSAGYEITAEGLRLVFTGDTGPSEVLEQRCTGADLALIESTWEAPVECDGLHLTVAEAMRYGALAKEFIMIHPLRGRSGEVLS